MGCVNKNSKEFKELSIKHNVDGNTLELITHQYWLETGNESLFPTDVYIQAQLGNTSYEESGESVRKLWELKYNSVQEFSSLEGLQKAQREANRYFPKSAIVCYKNAEGKYTLSIKRPVDPKAQSKKDNKENYSQEMQSIKEKAITDGTFMLAPNGKKSNLNEKQWLQVRTKAFKNWFGDWQNNPKEASKVVDDNGEPLVVYHGSKSNNITAFNSFYEKGTFFSTSKQVGKTYSSSDDSLYSVFINAKSPLIVDNKGKDWNKIDAEDLVEAAQKMFGLSREEFIESLGTEKTLTTDGIIGAISRLTEEEKSPYDALILKNVIETKDNEVATDVVTVKSNQIKSAVNNSGEFSKENNDIHYYEDKDLYFEKVDNMESPRDAKVLNLGLQENQTYTVDKLQSLYNKFNTDRTSVALADRVFSILKELNIKIVFNENFTEGKVGRYENNNTITLRKSFLERDLMNDKKANIILHEALHALSLYALSDKTKEWKRSKDLEFFRTEMNSLYQDLKNHPLLKGERGVKDLFEFVAELANPIFRNKIQQIDKENKLKEENKTKKSFWSRILEAFKALLSLHTTSSYYQRSMNALDKALNAFDIDAYMKYNGIKNMLRESLNGKKKEKVLPHEKTTTTELKSQYKGKLIYAQSGTGKSTIADNKTVFDSDYLLGEILGVSPETAGFFFKTLSAKQKKAFGEQYRNTIRQKVAEGFTVLTANEALLNEADVIAYNESVQQTEQRVNSPERAINNRYHAIEYHHNTLSKIKELENNENTKNKEYIKLDKQHYLADYLLSNNSNPNASNTIQSNKGLEGRPLRQRGIEANTLITDFLNEFGITVNLLDNYDGELPLFDALNRVINARNKEDLTNGVGYAIAFMMQGDPEMQRMVVSSHFGMKGDYNKKIPIINRTIKNLHPVEHSPVAQQILKEVGNQIAEELRNNFDLNMNVEEVKSNKPIWTIIKNFFAKLGMRMAAFGKRDQVKRSEGFFVKDIIEALGREDFSRIKGPLIKEGTTEKASRVYVEQALKDNPFEDNIIRILGNHGIALAGSASMALQGTLYRPSENPLHDIDFNASNNSSKETLDELLPTLFPKDQIEFASIIPKKGETTVTYVTFDIPFETRDRSKTGWTAKYYSKDGKYLGRKEGSELYLEKGVKGKLLDFFTGPTKESEHGFYKRTINGHEYLLSESNAAMAAKILWARPKDMWDYKNFKRNDFKDISKEFISTIPTNSLKEEILDAFDKKIYSQEIQDIKTKAIADGTFMIAPNGKPSKLNEKQWLQVRTKAFKDWFGDWENSPSEASKVVDENGEPMVVYRADKRDTLRFEGHPASYNVTGIYIAGNSKFAQHYAEPSVYNHNIEGVVYSIFVNAKNPIQGTRGDIDRWNNGELNDKDAWIYGNFPDGNGELVVRNPNQIKSATDNTGEFSKDRDEIAYYEEAKDFVNSMSDKQLQDEVDLIEQESADYDLINGSEEDDKQSINIYAGTGENADLSNFAERPFTIPAKYNQYSQVGYLAGLTFKTVEGAFQAMKIFTPISVTKSPYYKNEDPYSADTTLSDEGKALLTKLQDATGVVAKAIGKNISGLNIGSWDRRSSMMMRELLTYSFEQNPQALKRLLSTGNATLTHNQDKGKWGKEFPKLLMEVRERLRKQEKKVNSNTSHTFTFRDGTTINTPFSLNEQQKEALNKINDFIHSDKTSMTLSGYAGTGKTSIMEMVAKKVKREGKAIQFCATTNKAAAVLNDKVKQSGFKAQTLNKVFGIAVEVDSRKEYDANNLINKLKETDVKPGATIVIDEASMINEDNYHILNRIAEQYGLKVIYVGDPAQLPPINENKISIVFRDNNREKVTLTQVERTGDNAILKEATSLREGKPFSGESSFNNEGKGIAFILKSNKESIDAIIEHYAPKLQQNPEYFKILAYTNKAVADYNNQVRQLLGYNSPSPQIGEPMMGYSNWGYIYQTKTYKFINSESYKVIETKKPAIKTVGLNDGTKVPIEAVPITLQDTAGKRISVLYIDIINNTKNRENATKIAKEIASLFMQAKRTPNKREQAILLSKKTELEHFLFINDDIMDTSKGHARTLAKKVIDFGYALTIHKSQGSTFNNVLVDDVDVNKGLFAKGYQNPTLKDVDLSEDESNAPINLDDMEQIGELKEVDIDFSEEENATSTPQTSETVNEKQQLEYVGVSRATDTVTVISNNVKKEDSPLNHQNEVTGNTQATNNTSTIEYKNNGEITIPYTPKGKEQQFYTIKGNKIFNKNGEEVFKTNSTDRNKIFANLAVQQGRAVVVEYRERKYVVNTKNQIISVTTGNEMHYPEESGDRKAILAAAENKFQDPAVKAKQQKYQQVVRDTPVSIAQFESSPKPEADNSKDQRAPEVFNDNTTNVEVTSSDKTILSNEELKQWNSEGLGEKPRILVASEHSDPVFHVKQILDILEGKTTVAEWGVVDGKRRVVGQISGKDFAGLYLITKHDGLPLKRILKTKIPKLIHFSITSLGGTKYEPGVMKADDLLDRIKEYIAQGLDPNSITIRIDPIVPGVTTKEGIENIVKRASEMGIKRIRFSIMDAYPNTQAAMTKVGYDFSQFYYKKADGSYTFFANSSYISDLCDFMLSLKDKYGVTLGTCAEAIAKNGISKEGCLSVAAVNEMLGTTIEDKGTDNNKQRKLCSCYGGKIDSLQYNSNCASHCVYCYAKHENDKAMNYYNEDGTLKDNVYTRVNEGPSTQSAQQTSQDTATQQQNNQQQSTTPTTQQNQQQVNTEIQGVMPASTQTISLPNYAVMNNREDGISVDAGWKVPYLENLDNQISLENPPEKNKDINNQMNKVLQATSESEYLQEANSSSKEGVKKTLDNYKNFVQQIDKLLNSKYISSTEVRHVAEQIVNHISTEITNLQTMEGLAQKLFPSRKFDPNFDFLTATRKEIIDVVGINTLIQRVRALFSPQMANYSNIITMLQAQLIIENWDAIMALASDVFAFNEGFGITNDFKKGNFTTTQESKLDIKSQTNPTDNSESQVVDGQKSEQEQWQIDVRTIDTANSMTVLVKQAIHNCFVLERKEDGSIGVVVSKWKIPERVDPYTTVNNILSWVQGSLNYEDMLTRLKEKQKHHLWLSQLIERLSDKSGAESDLQSQFYSVFTKAWQNYAVGKVDKGLYYSMPVNNRIGRKEILSSMVTLFNTGRHPLFKSGGQINTTLLGSADTLSEEAEFNLHKASAVLNNAVEAIKHGYKFEGELYEKSFETIAKVCREALGFNVSDETLAESLNTDNLKTFSNSLILMNSILDKAAQAQKDKKLKDYNPFEYDGDYGISGAIRKMLTPITDILEDTVNNTFYENGELHQSYIIPSFWTNLKNKIHQDEKGFMEFLKEEYGASEWFKESGTKDYVGWRLGLLQDMIDFPEAREQFDHKVQLNFNGKEYMGDMKDSLYALSMMTEYYSEPNPVNGFSFAWYRVPIQSNKPSSDFVKLLAYKGPFYKEEIADKLYKMFLQEISRIQTVRMRNLSEDDPRFIKNFDTKGRKFCFLPVFNAYLENTEAAKKQRIVLTNEDGTISEDNNLFAELLQKKIEGVHKLTSEEDIFLTKTALEIITQNTQDKVNSILDTWEKNGIMEAAMKIKNICPKPLMEAMKDPKNIHIVRSQLENFLWNDTLASKSILQLTITDIAFYKDAEEMQKRLAQLHAPGMRGYKEVLDYGDDTRAPMRVSDGKYRTFILKDFDTYISDVIENISAVFDRKIAAAPEHQKASLIALKDSLVGEEGKYRKINVTDAQGYSSPTSYRKKAFIFGKWNKKAEKLYQNLLKGEYNYQDLETAFQPLKPFVYTRLQKFLGLKNAPITSIPVPFQAKNSEYLLFMADALLANEENLPKPNLLRAIYRVMEDSAYTGRTYKKDAEGKYLRDKMGNLIIDNLGEYNGKGIDTVQFESAIKSGLQGKIDISQFRDMPRGEEAAYTYMMNQIYQEQTDDNNQRVYKNYNTDTFVHETSFDDFCLQQEVPAHFKNHSQAQGSQFRMIIPSDLNHTTHDEKGNKVINYYEWREPSGEPKNVHLGQNAEGTAKKLTAAELKEEWEKTIAENIEDSLNSLAITLHLNTTDRKERNIALSQLLIEEARSSPRYGIDLIQACCVDDETGEFKVPKGEPIQAKRIEQFINALIKNRVNKQELPGGPVVQVSNYGFSKKLHIRFKDRNGGLIPLEEDYNAAKYNGMSYKEYLKENQGGIAYFEVYVPIWSNSLFEKFSNPDGSIDVKAIEAVDPELLMMVSNRIPTEDKYSCAPMKAVGFTPKEAGEAVMFPYELTEIDDSDFDVDKRYLMRKDIIIKTRNTKEYRKDLEKDLFEMAVSSYKKSPNHKKYIAKAQAEYEESLKNPDKKKHLKAPDPDKLPYEVIQDLRSQIEMFLDNPSQMKNTDPFMQWLWEQYKYIAYYTEAPTSGRVYRNNKIIDMSIAVLSNQETADKILNPGGFDLPKKIGYMVTAYKNPNNKLTWEQLKAKSIKELKDLSSVEKDLTFADAQIQFYKQNAAAASLIGVMAVNKVAHATLEGDPIWLDVKELCGEEPFTIAGTTFENRMRVDPGSDSEGTLIGKTLGSLVSAAADAAKENSLDPINVNMTTAGMFTSMLRLGMPFTKAALFLSQDVIGRLLDKFNTANLTEYKSLDVIIDEYLEAFEKKHKIEANSNIKTEPLTEKELIEGLTSGDHIETDYKVLLAYKKLQLIAEAMRNVSFATRFNSISSAVGPLIVDNLILEQKIKEFTLEPPKDSEEMPTTHFYDNEIGGNSVDINTIFKKHPILGQFSKTVEMAKNLLSDMPTGSTGFRYLMADFLSSGIPSRVAKDRDILNQLSGFYQSYLLIQEGIVEPSELEYYIKKFPLEFEAEYKKKYPNNEFIQAITLNYSKDEKPFLNIRLTGMKETEKERLSSAWIDLHKVDPELSKKLFDYCFFRAGIGFSPKTFISLVPTYIKERLTSRDGKTSYLGIFRHLPPVKDPAAVVDQFIRNNWQNTKLVPKKDVEKNKYLIDLNNGLLIADNKQAIESLTGCKYIKTEANKKGYHLWKYYKKTNAGNIIFRKIEPLGNNKEYLEMSLGSEIKPLDNNSYATPDNNPTDMKKPSLDEIEGETGVSKPSSSEPEATKEATELIKYLMANNHGMTKEGAEERMENIKNKPSLYKRFLQGFYATKGLNLNAEEALQRFKKMC